MQDLVKFKITSVSQTWDFPSNYFDIAIDSLTAVGLIKKERELCRNEMYRTLKSKGIALIRVVSNEDELEKELVEKYPGPEQNSSIWPETGKFQKNFSEDELMSFYSKFQVLTLEKRIKNAFKLGRDFTATNWWLVIQKP